MAIPTSVYTTLTGRRTVSPLQMSYESEEEQPLSYARRPEFYASGIPFTWEEKPGTAKEVAAPAVGLKDELEFHFCARFSKTVERLPSPVPMTCQHALIGQPLRPPPRLQSPRFEHFKHVVEQKSLSALESTHPLRMHNLAYPCGNPFLAAMEEMPSMEVFGYGEHHHRARLSSPLKTLNMDGGEKKPSCSEALYNSEDYVELKQGLCEHRNKRVACKHPLFFSLGPWKMLRGLLYKRNPRFLRGSSSKSHFGRLQLPPSGRDVQNAGDMSSISSFSSSRSSASLDSPFSSVTASMECEQLKDHDRKKSFMQRWQNTVGSLLKFSPSCTSMDMVYKTLQPAPRGSSC